MQEKRVEMRTRKLITLPLAGFTFFVGIAIAFAAFSRTIHMDLSQSADLPVQTASSAHRWDWTTQAWTNNDQPYQQIKAQTDRAVMLGNDPKQLIVRQAKIARLHPHNPQAQFAWGYATFVSLPQWGSDYEHIKRQTAPAEAMAALPVTDSYEYTRLRFLLAPITPYPNAVQPRSDQRYLDSLGQRLLQQDTSDYEVLYELICVEIAVIAWKPLEPAVKARLLKYAQELIQAKPKVDAYYSLPAAIYITYWTQSNSPDDARAAIAAYQNFLKVSSPGNDFRPTAKELIGVLQKALAHPKQ